VALKHDPKTGGLRWDRNTASARWTDKANRPDAVEFLEMLIRDGHVARVWDTLEEYSIPDLEGNEVRYIAKEALRKAAELEQLDWAMVNVLTRLIGGKRLKGERRIPPDLKAKALAWIRANPRASLTKIANRFDIARSTAAIWKAEALSDN
jgi:hypothetical protein